MILNREIYSMEKDKLVYDLSHPRDAKNVSVTAPEGEGVIKRGQVIDYKDGQYAVHVSGGVAVAIVAEDTPYADGDTEITAAVYISGTFRKSACISGVELETSDIENLRSKGIYLK